MTAETSNARGEWVLERLRGVLEHGKMGDKCLIAPDLVTAAIASLSAPPPPAARGDVPYDRELIARMLDVCGHPMFTLDAYREQARLLREADNAGAEKVGTARALTAAQQQGLRIVEPIRNCATPESREAAMVVLETDAEGNPTIWCDPEIADLVRALNVGGVRTKASCSGHGEKPFGIVSLQDGRELLVLPDWETTRRAERILDAGLSAQQQGQAVAWADEWRAAVAAKLSSYGLSEEAAAVFASSELDEYKAGLCDCAENDPVDMVDLMMGVARDAIEKWKIESAGRPFGHKNTAPPPSAPVGVEAIAAEIRASLGRGATVCTRRRWAIELEALAQQPAPSAPVGVEWPLSLLRAEHWREVYIGHRCMRLEVTYDYATWERLMEQVEAALAQQPAAVGEEIMVNAAHDVFTLPLQPSGLSSGPRFVVHVPAPEQQPAAVDEAMVERAAAAVMSAPPGISVEAYVRIVLEAALAAQPGGSDNDR